jgi:hypothetical protein
MAYIDISPQEQGGSMPISTYTEAAQTSLPALINQLRTLHRQGVDVSDAYKAIEVLKEKDDEQSRVQRTLQGTAETALLGQPANLFVLAYRVQGLTRAAYGFVRRNGHVTIELGHAWPISTSAESMLELQERIAKSGMAYAIAYAKTPEPTEEAETTVSFTATPAPGYVHFWEPGNPRQG